MIQIDGGPTVTASIGFLPPPDFQAETIADFMVLGHIMTAAPPIKTPGGGCRCLDARASRRTAICR